MQAAIKEFFEDSLNAQAAFHMGELYEFVSCQCLDVNIADLGRTMESMKARGEIEYAPVAGTVQPQYYNALPPRNTQTTLFGVPGQVNSKQKSKPFSKKQKKAAHAALSQIMASMAHYPQEFRREHESSLQRLHEWLGEQVAK